MKFMSWFTLRKRRNRNPNDDLTATEKGDETQSSDSDRQRRSEGEEEEEEEVKEDGGDANEEVERVRETKRRRNDGPPVDDCCPICFGSFAVPCRAPCGHWYCGDCILQYWNHGAALQPCKCPMCSQKITKLIPEASLDHCQNVEILENVRKYNRIFVGGTYGLILKTFELPLLIKRIFREMMDPDAADNHLFKARLFAIFLGALYTISPLNFLPAGRLDAIDLFDNFAIAMCVMLYVVGLYRRRRRLQQGRQLVP